MATPLNSNLYPPILPTYAPAFLRTENCIIKFSLSSYNSINDIQGAELSLRYQSTDASAAVDGKKKLGMNNIISYTKKEIHAATEENMYYIILPVDNVSGGAFDVNTIYKVQIRFIGTNQSSELVTSVTSEWSTVCLLLSIDKPYVKLKNLDLDFNIGETVYVTDIQQTLDIVGRMSFTDSREKDFLSKWRAVIYDNETKKLVYDTNEIYTASFADPNDINYTVPYVFPIGKKYYMEITYTTNSQYTFTNNYIFNVIDYYIPKIDADMEVVEDKDFGALTLNIFPIASYSGLITIRRSSSKSRFTIWEDIYTHGVKFVSDRKWVYKDTTVESGIWYKYQIQKRNSKGDRGKVITSKEAIVTFEDIFIADKEKMLCLKYNPNISSMNINVAEGKSDTIGSKYPYVRRNGNMKYKSFPISGTLSYLGDIIDENNLEEILSQDSYGKREEYQKQQENIFYNRKKELGEDIVKLYEDFNLEHNINEYEDEIIEKEYREKVVDFLFNNTVKIFRSATEGNLLVKLLSINLTPNQTLGRRIYDFSAEVIEIDDFNFKNLELYNVYNIGSYEELTSYATEAIKQMKIKCSDNSIDVIELLKNTIDKTETENYKNQYSGLNDLKIEFQSNPRLIIQDGQNLRLKTDADVVDDKDLLLGYIIKVNGEDRFVNQNGIFIFNKEDIELGSLEVMDDIVVDVYYNILQTEKIEAPKTTYTTNKIGQIKDSFDYDEDVVQKIIKKHFVAVSGLRQNVLNIFGLRIEGNQGVCLELKTADAAAARTFIISDTELLNFTKDTNEIESCKIKGIYLKKAKGDFPFVDEYAETNEFTIGYSSLVNPKNRFIYHFNEGDSLLDDLYINNVNKDCFGKEIVLDDTIILENGMSYTIDKNNSYIYVEKKDEGETVYSLVLIPGEDYIFYNGMWYEYERLDEKTISLNIPVDLLIDYSCLIRGEVY